MALFDKTQPDLKGLAALAHQALNADNTTYVRNKALISQFFSTSRNVKEKEVVRLTLIDSLYSTNVAARRYFGITHIADELCRTFPDDTTLKKHAAEWIAAGFDTSNPLYGLFDNEYGVDKSGTISQTAVSLLSKYLYFLTNYSFPIHDNLGAKYHSQFYRTRTTGLNGFQKRFLTLRHIKDTYGVATFDELDAFFYLLGKVKKEELSPLLDRARYVELTRYQSIAAAITDVHAGKNAGTLKKILGSCLYEFMRRIKELEKE